MFTTLILTVILSLFGGGLPIFGNGPTPSPFTNTPPPACSCSVQGPAGR